MVRLFPAQLDHRRMPVLLKGEVERAMLPSTDLSFGGAVGGIEGQLSDEYRGGYAMLTNYRIIWSYDRNAAPVEGYPCHVPLGAVARCNLKSSLLQLKQPRIRLDVRLDERGYPSSDPLHVARLARLKLVVRAGSADAWAALLEAAVERRAWAAAPPGLLAELHAAPPPGSIAPPSSGPMTPPPHRLHELTGQGGGPPPPPAAAGPRPDERMLLELERMGFPRLRAANALLASGSAGVQQAVDWLLDHQDSPLLLDKPLPAGGAALAAAAAAQGAFAGASLAAALPPAAGLAPRPPSQQQQAAAPPGYAEMRQASLGGVGVGGILRREERRVAATERSLDEAFTDLNQLMRRAAEMVALAESLRDRMSRCRRAPSSSSGGELAGPALSSAPSSDAGSEADEEERMDDALAQGLADLGIASPVTRETAGKLYYRELARQLAAFLQGPVEAAGGMLPLPEVYRRFNRARFIDLVSPDDLLQAVRLFPAIKAPLALREFPSGVKVVQSAAVQEEAVCRRVAELAAGGAAAGAAGGGAAAAGGSPWRTTLGPGVTAAEAAAALLVPLPVAGQHLVAAEARGLLCRDDGPEGLRFHTNFFTKAVL